MPNDSRPLAIASLVLMLSAGVTNIRMLSFQNVHARASSLVENNPSALARGLQQRTKKEEAGSIADTVASLHRIAVDYTKVPLEARPLLTRLKYHIRDVISHALNDAGTKPSTSIALRTRIWNQLTAGGITTGQPRERSAAGTESESKYGFGDLYDVEVSKPLHHPELIAVTTTLEIPCGRDSSLYIFRKHHRDWRLILAQEANDYDLVSGAQGLFNYRISPGYSKQFFVVTVNVNPWCTSNWQSIRYSALRAGSSAYKPHVLASGEETIYLGVAPPPYKLVVTRKWFGIRFNGESSQAQIMNGITSRDHLVKYLVAGNRAVRLSH
jgi:hypothetical protein